MFLKEAHILKRPFTEARVPFRRSENRVFGLSEVLKEALILNGCLVAAAYCRPFLPLEGRRTEGPVG